MPNNPPAGKGRAHPLFPDRVGIAPAEEVSNPECWLPHAVGRAVSKRVWRSAGGEYQDDGRVLVVEQSVEQSVEPGTSFDTAEDDLLGYVGRHFLGGIRATV